MATDSSGEHLGGAAVILGRRPGEGIFIGRDVRATILDPIIRNGHAWAQIRIEVSGGDAVTPTHHPIGEHLSEQAAREAERAAGGEADSNDWILGQGDGIRIGRGVVIVLTGMERDSYVRLKIEVPRRVAVTRDDYSFEEHMRFQTDRERGKLTVPGRAV